MLFRSVLEREFRTFLAWEPYVSTPDYEPKPEPKHGVKLLTPTLSPTA